MSYNKNIELFRNAEYPMLSGITYLDHGGTTIYARSLIDAFSLKMVGNLYGNPHSSSDPARLSSAEVDKVRLQALSFFGADPEHFDLIFVANATAAIKLVAESFHDLALASSTSRTFWYGYHKDAHTSLVGVRELTQGTHHCFASDEEVNDWLTEPQFKFNIPNRSGIPGLFAYPGQSNMTGRRLPRSWPRDLRSSSRPHHQNTYSLLDAAALATTTPLDFSDPDSAADFTALSFYKIFGFPDLGALIVRKESGHILSWRRYFGGGTVNMLTVLHEPTVNRKETNLHEALEDGTLPFHNIVALGCAIDTHKQLYGSMGKISRHTSFLSYRLYIGMSSLHQSNGMPVCMVHHEDEGGSAFRDALCQGSTIAFNVLRPDGSYLRHSIVEELANEEKIFLRSGGLCNPGGVASCLGIEPWQFKRAWSAGYRCGQAGPLEIINGKPTGVVRVSLGAMSTVQDVDTFLEFLARTFLAGPEKSLECMGARDHDSFDRLDFDWPRGESNNTILSSKMSYSLWPVVPVIPGQAPGTPHVEQNEARVGIHKSGNVDTEGKCGVELEDNKYPIVQPIDERPKPALSEKVSLDSIHVIISSDDGHATQSPAKIVLPRLLSDEKRQTKKKKLKIAFKFW